MPKNKLKILIFLGAIIMIAFLAYLPVLKNGFIGIDDHQHIVANNDIKILDFNHLKRYFSKQYDSLYQPLVTLSYAIEYHFFNLNPSAYHLTNLIIHLLNIILVFFFIYLLTKKNFFVAAATTTIFALHPLSVEPVAWIAARGSLLYVTFLLLALCFYLKYVEKDKQEIKAWTKYKFLVLTFFFFLLSIFSKSLAVVLPLLLMLLDYYKNRLKLKANNFFKNNKILILEKIPFLAVSLITGLMAIKFRGPDNLSNVNYSMTDNFFVFFAAIFTYISKLILPINLSFYYPYPDKLNNLLPINIYLDSIIIFIIILIIIFSKKYKKELIFSGLFFLINLILFLRIIPAANLAFISERYVYVSMISFWFVLFFIFYKKTKNLKQIKTIKKILIVFLIAYLTFFILTINKQVKIWNNDEIFFNDILKTETANYMALHALGVNNLEKGNYKEALNYFDACIKENIYYIPAYINRGEVKKNMGDFNGALEDFEFVLKRDPDNKYNYVMYANMGSVKTILGKYEEAEKDLDKALELNPEYPLTYNFKGLLSIYKKNSAQAKEYFDKSLEINPDDPMVYHNRGVANFNLKNYQDAQRDSLKAIQLAPDLIQAYLNLAQTKNELNENPCPYIEQARKINEQDPLVTEYFNKYCNN